MNIWCSANVLSQEGVKVGYVVDIKSLSATKEVTVRPYANVYKENSFYLYSKDTNTSN